MANRVRRLKGSGWYGESRRHSLASKGVETGRKRKLKVPRQKRVRKLKAEEGSLESLAGKDLSREPSGPGKFEGNYSDRFAKAIHQTFGDGMGDEELGDVQDFGWYGKLDVSHYEIKEDGYPIIGVIAMEDNSGFFTYISYSTRKVFEKDWKQIEKDYEKFSAESGDSLG